MAKPGLAIGMKRVRNAKAVASSAPPTRKKKLRRVEPPVAPPASDAVTAFRKLVENYRYPQTSIEPWPLTNITFLAGAGFSKSWDAGEPQLF